MTLKQLKELIPIMVAFTEGKTIQVWTNDTWEDIEHPCFGEFCQYRIKPEPKYRPFKNIDECWEEIQNHQPVGWVTTKVGTKKYCMAEVSENSNWNYLFDTYIFADGTPYGIAEK